MSDYRVDTAFPKVGTLYNIETGESWDRWSEDTLPDGKGSVRYVLTLAGEVVINELRGIEKDGSIERVSQCEIKDILK